MDFTAKQLHALKTLLDMQRKVIAEDTQLAIKASETKVIERIDTLENNLLQVMEDTANTYTHQDDFAKLTGRVTKLEQQ